ncbi:MAG TPA: hypothetical protein VI229_04100 [Burkholderiales bacterium]
MQKALIERQQRTDAFNLQMKQSQDALQAAPADRQSLDARQFSDRQRLDNLNEQQLRDVKSDAQIQPELRPYERQKLDLERQPFRGPVVVVPAKPAPKTEPILPPHGGIQLETPR